MKPIWKQGLKDAFHAPPAQRKREFIQTLDQGQISVRAFAVQQAAYIRKWNWGVSAAVFILSLAAAEWVSMDMLWGISALAPLLALTVVSECGRSEFYQMAELEMATQFSLRSVLLVRLVVLGVENLVILGLLAPVVLWKSCLHPLQAGVYILTPFLLTAGIGLYLMRRFRQQEAVYVCAGAAVLVSFSVFFFQSVYPQIYREGYLAWWLAVMLLSAGAVVRQYQKIVYGMEEFV